MATIHFDIPVATTAEHAWSRLSALDQVHHLVSFLGSARVDGNRRVCSMAEGAPISGELDEVILGIDEHRRRLAYAIVDSPFGFTHHAASMQIVETENEARFVWTTDVLPDSVAQNMADMFANEAKHIAQQLAKAR